MTSLDIALKPWTPGQPAEFTGYGVTLRSMTANMIDDEFVARLCDPAVSENLSFNQDASRISRDSLLRDLAKYDNRRNFYFGIWPEGGNRVLGFLWARTDASGVSVPTQ